MTNRSRQDAGFCRFFYILVSRYFFRIPMTDFSQNLKVVVASDVSGNRDGIGVEIYLEGEFVIEVFRDDTKKSREVTCYKRDVPLALVEESIAIFKKEIPWNFIDDNSAE